jgi:hypothetical protein
MAQVVRARPMRGHRASDLAASQCRVSAALFNERLPIGEPEADSSSAKRYS